MTLAIAPSDLYRIVRDAAKVSSVVTLAASEGRATATSVGIDCRIRVGGPAGSGALAPVAIEAAPLLDVLKSRPDEPPATVEQVDGVLVVRHGHLHLKVPVLPGRTAELADVSGGLGASGDSAALLAAAAPVVERDGRHGVALVWDADGNVEALGFGRQLHCAVGRWVATQAGRFCMSRQAAEHVVRLESVSWALVDDGLFFFSETTRLRVSRVHDTYPASWRDLVARERYLLACRFDVSALRFAVDVAGSALSKADIAVRMRVLGTAPDGTVVWELRGLSLVSKVEAAESVVAAPVSSVVAWDREIAAKDLIQTLAVLQAGTVELQFGERLVHLVGGQVEAFISTLT